MFLETRFERVIGRIRANADARPLPLTRDYVYGKSLHPAGELPC